MMLSWSLWLLWLSLSHAAPPAPSPHTEGEQAEVYLITTVHTGDPSGFQSHLKSLQQEGLGLPSGDVQVVKVYEHLLGFSVPRLPHYAARLTPRGLSLLEQRSDVLYMERDQAMSIKSCETQQSPEWGLSRVNQRGAFELGTFAYDTRFAGGGVNIYIIDTGIYCENNDFVNKVEGTCTYGIDVIDGSNVDGNGHGTHCAGTAAGQKFGVAKGANLIAVRVLNNIGTGSTSGIVDGINWMVGDAQTSGNSSVANLSLGGSFSLTLNSATAAAVLSGISMIVAAGNDNDDACNYSPASTSSAVTVGATDDMDQRAIYSNYGSCLDIFGPGSSIQSAYIGSPSATATLSGTSMAAPHIAGIAAVYQSIYNFTLSPNDVTNLLISQATANVLKDVNGSNPIGIGNDESPNLMGYVYTCNGTTKDDNKGIFGTSKSAFRAFSVIFLCFSGFELGLGIPSLRVAADGPMVLTFRTAFLSFLTQCLLLPVVSLVLIELANFHKEYSLSILMVSIAPSGIISSIVSNYSKLNIHLASVLAFTSNVFSVLVVPVLFLAWVIHIWDLDDGVATFSWNRFIIAPLVMVLLTITGILVRVNCAKLFSKFVELLISAANALIFTIIMILGVSIYQDAISHASRNLWAVAFLLQVFGGLSSWILAFILRVPFLDRLTVSIDAAGRGFIFAIALLTFAFHSDKKEDLVVYPLIFGIVAILNLLWVIPLYRFASWMHERSQPPPDDVVLLENVVIFGSSQPPPSSPQSERNYSMQRTPSPAPGQGQALGLVYDDEISNALIDGKKYPY